LDTDNALVVDGLDVYYGESHVLHGVSWNTQPARVTALLGRNGAGKSTTVQSIVGLLGARRGRIVYRGRELQRASPEAISHSGVAFVPQGRRVFGSLSVRENLDVAARRRVPPGRHPWRREDVLRIFPRLGERLGHAAQNLSGGEQQMLAIGRALMTCPSLLLLDEPSEGLAPQIVHELQGVIGQLREHMAVVLVEQNLGLALALADDVVVLDTGRVVFAGTRAQFEAEQAQLQVHLSVG
jgi:branched-chain amino acid transport system ATP-binding protein